MRTEKAQPAADNAAKQIAAAANGAGATEAGVIDQVRELLFGETKRTTEQNLKALEDKVDALTAHMNARFSELESQLAEARRDGENAQAAAIDDIGAAIAQLGANIRNMSGVRKAK